MREGRREGKIGRKEGRNSPLSNNSVPKKRHHFEALENKLIQILLLYDQLRERAK